MWLNRRETLERSPSNSAVVLAGGACMYWLLCMPAVFQRGWPPIDPFWEFMPLLWPVPVFISAIYEDNSRTRNRQLLIYSLAIGLAWSAMASSPLVPRRVTFEGTLLGLLVAAPLAFGLNWLIERLSQFVLSRVRGFELSDRCGNCGYCILHLDTARCPECGKPFDARWLDGDFDPPRATPRPWRTGAIATAVLVAGVLSPFAYHELALIVAADQGRRAAEQDWDKGNPLLYLRWEEAPASFTRNTYDVDTGFEIRYIQRGLVPTTRQEAYRAVIQQKLARNGPPPRSGNVLDRGQIRQLLKSDVFTEIHQFPFRVTKFVTIEQEDGRLMLRINSPGASIGYSTSAVGARVHIARPDGPDGLAFVLWGDDILMSFTAEGELLQWIDVENGEVAHPPLWTPDAQPDP